ncbi:MAG: hypothetical protein ACYC5M_04520 [Anaerolineae bacterium]
MLQSFIDSRGYVVCGTDGEVGKAFEFILDDRDWKMRYIVVDTAGWLNGDKVLLSTDYLRAPEWQRRVLRISLSRAEVQSSLTTIKSDLPISEASVGNTPVAVSGKAWHQAGTIGQKRYRQASVDVEPEEEFILPPLVAR